MKLCKDCKWARGDGSWANNSNILWQSALCAHPKFLSAVDGSLRYACDSVRGELDACGPDGEFWEAR